MGLKKLFLSLFHWLHFLWRGTVAPAASIDDNTMDKNFTNTRWMVPAMADFSYPQVWFYRNVFTNPERRELELLFSADEFAVVFLDGERVGEGPERGTESYWSYGRLKLDIAPGTHCLVFCVNNFGTVRQMAQLTIEPGLWVLDESGLIAEENWSCAPMGGCTFFPPQPDWCGTPRAMVGPGYSAKRYAGKGNGWRPVEWRDDGRVLHEPLLPPMLYEPEEMHHVDGEAIWHFNQYFTGWGHYRFTGSGMARIRWFENPAPGNFTTDDCAGMFEDVIYVDGSCEWRDLGFHAGNCVSITCGANVSCEAHFYRTGYPWQWNVELADADPAAQHLLQVAAHTLRCCTRDTFMDCPFYEQMQYVADTRIEMLTLFSISSDTRLARKAVRLLSMGIFENGMMRDRYPDRYNPFNPDGTVKTVCSVVIPSFALFFIQMVHDLARLQIDDGLVCEMLPKLRTICKWMKSFVNSDGLLQNLPGWNFIDWLSNWKGGCPGSDRKGACTLNWLYVQSLRDMAELERKFGTPDAAVAFVVAADDCQCAVERCFFDKEKGLFAEDLAHTCFSEHAQVFAVIAGRHTELLPALERGGLDECGICFSFYYLEVCRKYNLRQAFDRRMKKYLDLVEKTGVTTLPEEFASWRSWCHAWGAHFPYFKFSRHSIFDRIFPDA